MSKQVQLKKRSLPKRHTGWLAIAAILVVTGAVVSVVVWNSASTTSYPLEMTAREVLAERSTGAFVVDVREPSEWAEYHLSDSVLIPLGELPSRLDEIPRDKKIVVVCRSGNRSASGRDILMEAGFKQVTSLKGGLTGWRAQGFPTIS